MKNRALIYILTLFIVTIPIYIFTPSLVNRIIYKTIDLPFYIYSPVARDFVAVDFRKEEALRTPSGVVFSEKAYDSILPLFNYRQLAMDGKLPIVIDGDTLDLARLQEKNFSSRYRADTYSRPTIDLNLLYEANNGKVALEMPLDVMRIGDKVEFINPETNKVDKAKSEEYTKILLDAGFEFPAGFVAGNNSPKKSYDQGFFVRDAKNDLFHLMMVDGQAQVNDTKLPDNIVPRFFTMSEQGDLRFYGFLYAEDGSVYIIQRGDFNDATKELDEQEQMQLSAAACATGGSCASCMGCSSGGMFIDRPLANDGNYLPIKLDIDSFDIETDQMSIFGNALNWTVTITGDKLRTVYALNRLTLGQIKRHDIAIPDSRIEQFAKYVMPISIDMQDSASEFINPKISFNGYISIIVNFILALATFFVLRRRAKNIAAKAALFVLFFGLFAMIALYLAPVSLNDKFNA